MRGRVTCLVLSSAIIVTACGGGGSDIAASCDASGAACLSWDLSISPDVVGYRVYFGTAPGVYDQDWGAGLDAGSANFASMNGLTSGTRYYFAVTAYDAYGRQSGFSNEVSKLVR